MCRSSNNDNCNNNLNNYDDNNNNNNNQQINVTFDWRHIIYTRWSRWYSIRCTQIYKLVWESDRSFPTRKVYFFGASDKAWVDQAQLSRSQFLNTSPRHLRPIQVFNNVGLTVIHHDSWSTAEAPLSFEQYGEFHLPVCYAAVMDSEYTISLFECTVDPLGTPSSSTTSKSTSHSTDDTSSSQPGKVIQVYVAQLQTCISSCQLSTNNDTIVKMCLRL